MIVIQHGSEHAAKEGGFLEIFSTDLIDRIPPAYAVNDLQRNLLAGAGGLNFAVIDLHGANPLDKVRGMAVDMHHIPDLQFPCQGTVPTRSRMVYPSL